MWALPIPNPAKAAKPHTVATLTTFEEVDHLRGDSPHIRQETVPNLQKNVGIPPEDGQEREDGQAEGLGEGGHLRPDDEPVEVL